MLLSINPVYGKELECWFSGGKRRVIEAPILPHFWSYAPRRDAVLCKPVDMHLLSNMEENVKLYQCLVEDRRRVRDLRNADSLEAGVPYTQVLNTLYGFKQHDMDLTHGAWDIEVSSPRGRFPRMERDPISAISYFSRKTQKTFSDEPEYEIISRLVDAVQECDPDILDTYNGPKFDYRYTAHRAAVNNVPFILGRKNDAPYIRRREFQGGKRKGVSYTVFIKGRLSLDVYKEVDLDTYLTGKIKNKQLKTVARYFFGDEFVVEVDRAAMGSLTSDELYWYCFSDSRLTFLLAEIYLMVLKYAAVTLDVPLDFIINRSPSHIGNLIFGRGLKALNVVSDGFNAERFEGVLWDVD